MGQYYYVVNIDKREYLHPHKFGEGLKLSEFAFSRGGTMTGLALLLADGNGRGGGDIRAGDPGGLIGSWAGDRIVIAGDYADPGKFLDGITPEGHNPDDEPWNLHGVARETFKDISGAVAALIEQGA